MVEWLVSAGLLALAATGLVWSVRGMLGGRATRLRGAVAAGSLVLGLIVLVTWTYALPFTFRTVLAVALALLTLLTTLLRGRRKPRHT